MAHIKRQPLPLSIIISPGRTLAMNALYCAFHPDRQKYEKASSSLTSPATR